jgi:hypothetical protein
MAITRAQQAKQMLREGGRIGLKGGADASMADFGKVTTPGVSAGRKGPGPAVGAGGASFRNEDNFQTLSSIDEGVRRRNQIALENAAIERGEKALLKYRDTAPEKSKFPGLLGVGVNALNAIFPNLRKRNIDYFLDNKSINRSEYPSTIEGFKKYMADRSGGNIDASGRDIIDREGRDDPMQIIYNQGQGGIGDNEETEDSNNNDPFVPNFRLLADGGMPEDAPVYEGGIMDLESARQMYGLGKLVKKITRGVKKVAKSPIGKAALLYFGGNALAGGGLKSFLLGSNAGPSFSKTGLLQKMFLKNPSLGFSLGNLSGTAIAGVPAALSYFMTPKEDDSDEELYLGPELDMEAIKNKPMDFINYRNRADGGIMRAGYEEGGDAEPVAKKTMPLLDMDGMEKDYREDGGFVPIGRMEKADDVPARLSKNEFVFTADAVRNAGEGDIDKGAEVMYNMMKNLEAGGEVSEESQGLEGAREMFQTSQRLEEVI